MNSAPFHFSWEHQNGDHHISRETSLIYRVFKRQDRDSNSAVIDAMHGPPGSVIEYNTKTMGRNLYRQRL